MKVPFHIKVFSGLSLIPGLMIFCILWILPSTEPISEHNARAMRGFSNIWAAGHAAATGQTRLLFDQNLYASWVRHLFGPNMVNQMWGYPPSALLIAVPLSLIPPLAGFVVWTLLGPFLFWISIRRTGIRKSLACACLVSPAVLACVLSGQSGCFTSALLISGLWLSSEQPFLGGILMGTLCIKPQMALLLPLCLIAGNRFYSILWTAITSLLLLAISVISFGISTWTGFLFHTLSFMSNTLQMQWTGSPVQLDFVSVFMAARALGLGLDSAWMLQGFASVICAVVCWKLWRTGRPTLDKICATIPLSILVTPYAHDYDLVATAVVVAVLAHRGLESGWKPVEKALLAFAWSWPGLILLAPTVFAGLKPWSGLISCTTMVSLVVLAMREVAVQDQRSQLMLVEGLH